VVWNRFFDEFIMLAFDSDRRIIRRLGCWRIGHRDYLDDWNELSGYPVAAALKGYLYMDWRVKKPKARVSARLGFETRVTR